MTIGGAVQAKQPILSFARGAYIFGWGRSLAGYELRDDPPPAKWDHKKSGWDVTETTPPFIVARPGAVEAYRPLGVVQLPRRFAEVETAEDVLAFAGRWGLLGAHEVLLDDSASFGVPAESVAAWLAESARIRCILAWWDAVRSGDYGRCSAFVRWTHEPVGRVEVAWTPTDDLRALTVASAPIGEYGGERPELWQQLNRDQIVGTVEALRYAVHHLVNERLAGDKHKRTGSVAPQLFPWLGPKVLLVPDSLLSALYCLLAFELAELPELEHCLDCGKPLVGGTARRRFCGDTCRQRFNYRQRKQGRKHGKTTG